MDTSALQELARRVESASALERQTKEEREKWLSGARDAQGRSDARKDVRQAEERVTRVEKSGHAPTVAAAYLLHGDALDTATFFDPAVDTFQRVVASYRKARAVWPEVRLDERLSDALLQVAAWRAAASSPSLKAALEKGRRVYSLEMLLHRASNGAAGAEVIGALRRQPELAEATALRRADAVRHPGLGDWTLARLAGDTVLEQAAVRAFERSDLAVSLALDVKLRPDNDGDQAELALFKAGPRTTPPLGAAGR
jgi:cellulose synthase operon protein C